MIQAQRKKNEKRSIKKGKEVGAVTRCNSVIVEVTRRIQLGELSPSPSTFEIAKSMINNLDKSTN